jgi:hypothetical protein
MQNYVANHEAPANTMGMKLEANVDGDAAEVDEAVEIIVFTANGGRSASSTSSTNTSDRVAVKTNSGTDVFNKDVDEGERLDRLGSQVILALDCVAALNGTSLAVTTVGSGREGEESRGNEDGGFGEHGWYGDVGVVGDERLWWLRTVELSWRNIGENRVVFICFDSSSKTLGMCRKLSEEPSMLS